jgi:hypothetical protein
MLDFTNPSDVAEMIVQQIQTACDMLPNGWRVRSLVREMLIGEFLDGGNAWDLHHEIQCIADDLDFGEEGPEAA